MNFIPNPVTFDGLREQLKREQAVNADLLKAAKEALALLRKGAPGWGVAKDLLNAAIHKASERA